MTELHENKLKRLIMQSNRRGMKENDIILGNFAKKNIVNLNFDELNTYESLLIENDQDIYLWISGEKSIPSQYEKIINKIVNTLRGQKFY